MLTGKGFSNAKWRDIEDTRARLEAYKNRCQPYPAIEPYRTAEQQVSPPAEEPESMPVHSNHLQKQIDQARSGFIHLQTVLNKHIDASKKAAVKKGTETSPSELGRIDITNKIYPNA